MKPHALSLFEHKCEKNGKMPFFSGFSYIVNRIMVMWPTIFYRGALRQNALFQEHYGRIRVLREIVAVERNGNIPESHVARKHIALRTDRSERHKILVAIRRHANRL